MHLRSFQRSWLSLLSCVATGALFVFGCGDGPFGIAQDARGADVTPDAAAPDGGAPDAAGTNGPRVDVLVMVDDSSSMADKEHLLAGSIPDLIGAIAPGRDVHFGVISSSLGAMGGDVCSSTGDANRLAHLSTRAPDGGAVAAAAQGFLALAPGGDVDAFVRDAVALITGVGETGCGFEAQLESVYRFLVQPDPWATVRIDENKLATFDGIDETVLAQRKAFLRPDSLVVVLMLTDEDDSSVDPRSLGGQGWAFEALKFPGSTTSRKDGTSTTAPRATSACATDPTRADCTSCGYAFTCNTADSTCQKIKADPECQKNGGYYGPDEDSLNVRFHRMKQRFGVDPQYPIARYVDGLSASKVPDRASEHVEQPASGSRRSIGAYEGTPTCQNPLFSASLPSSASEELCNLPPGPRTPDQVVFALIGGVPAGLTGREGSAPDFRAILGADPDRYDETGIDPHMIASILPRAGLPAPSATRGDNGPDPVHGREWETKGDDLQYACTFALPSPRTCTEETATCDCASNERVPPTCGAALGVQVRGRAYPTLRELRVARELGDRAFVGSICPTDAAQGYGPTMATLVDRLGRRLLH